MTQSITIETHSPQETEALGEAISRLLPIGSLVTLRGDLAAGKTCLVRGMAKRFQTGEAVASPTFTIVNQYGNDPKFYHVDLYRMADLEEVADLGYDELFEPDGICAVEWAERAEGLLPEKRVDILLEHAGEDSRRITISNLGVLQEGWQAALSN